MCIYIYIYNLSQIANIVLKMRVRFEGTFFWQGQPKEPLQQEDQCTSGEDHVQGAVSVPLQVHLCFKNKYFRNSLAKNEDTVSQFESKYTEVCPSVSDVWFL